MTSFHAARPLSAPPSAALRRFIASSRSAGTGASRGGFGGGRVGGGLRRPRPCSAAACRRRPSAAAPRAASAAACASASRRRLVRGTPSRAASPRRRASRICGARLLGRCRLLGSAAAAPSSLGLGVRGAARLRRRPRRRRASACAGIAGIEPAPSALVETDGPDEVLHVRVLRLDRPPRSRRTSARARCRWSCRTRCDRPGSRRRACPRRSACVDDARRRCRAAASTRPCSPCTWRSSVNAATTDFIGAAPLPRVTLIAASKNFAPRSRSLNRCTHSSPNVRSASTFVAWSGARSARRGGAPRARPSAASPASSVS